MITDSQPITIVIDGTTLPIDMQSEEALVRAVWLSLFTWRRALPGDVLPDEDPMGWWGDSTLPDVGDKFGSRLWLLARELLVNETVLRAQEYAKEALQWLIDDGVAARIEVTAQRSGLTSMQMVVVIYKQSGQPVALRFDDFWRFINGV